MSVEARGWFAVTGGQGLEERAFRIGDPGAGEVILAVEACGLCHTDLGFASGEVAPRHALPLVLGHEMVGRVVEAGSGAEPLRGARVLVPAVLPCGECAFCRAGRGNACPDQKMPGNDCDGGFASHARLPSRSLIRVSEQVEPSAFRALGVVADAVSTAYQAVHRAKIGAGDVVAVVGVGGVGAFVVQIAKALGAHVLACDVSGDRLALASAHGAERTLDVKDGDARAMKAAVADLAKAHAVPSFRHLIFECSGNPKGQALAYAAIPRGGTLVVVGYTIEKIQVRLSNLMALDATAFGTWGCPPELYPDVLALIEQGSIRLAPFLEEAPMSRLNACLTAMAEHRLEKRMVLVPDLS